MPFVLGASITACWAFRDETHPHADLTLARIRTEEALAPSIWWFDVRNILVVNERRTRLRADKTAAFLRDLSRLAVILDRTLEEREVLRLARTHRLFTLEVAKRYNLALSTLDADLASAARIARQGRRFKGGWA